MKFFSLFIAALISASAWTAAAEDMSETFENLSGVTYMEDEDMDFSSVDDDAFSTEQNAEISALAPMIQRRPTEKKAETTPAAAQKQEPDSAKKNDGAVAPSAEEPTLTDALKQQEKETMGALPLPDVSGTWVDKLARSIPSQGGEKTKADSEADDTIETTNGNIGLQKMVENSKKASSRSNASVFDISGIMLRMTLAQAEKAMMTRGFKLISQKLEVPNFIKWRNEEKCRGNGVVGYEHLMNCVVDIAKKNNHQYVEVAKFSKFSTKEEVEIKLTSNFTGNKVYYISYKSSSGRVIGSGAKAAYLRNIKVFDFWKKVNQKYGAPDNKDEVTWGLGAGKPYMKAATGFLLLEDPMLRELDYTRMSREDQRFMNTDLYSF